MRQEWQINQAAFDRFLSWLDADRECAGAKYEEIRRRLIKIFTCRGCSASDELADETINRVIRKIQQLADSYTGDPARYFYGVAKNVLLEQSKKTRPLLPLPVQDSPEHTEQEYKCLETCMNSLTQENRTLVLEYYREEKRAKIAHRKELAERFGIAVTALRLRAHRIRASLQICVENCVRQ